MRLIDADALIPMMKYATTDSEIGVFPIKIGFNDIEKVINEQPTIEPRCETCETFNKIRLLIPQPQRKTGRWLYDEERCATGIYAICSACDESIYQTGNFRYCPNCGARMMEGEG